MWDFLLETQERVRNSLGKRAISVRATEVLLHIKIRFANARACHQSSCLRRVLIAFAAYIGQGCFVPILSSVIIFIIYVVVYILTLKALNKNCSRRHIIYIYIFFFFFSFFFYLYLSKKIGRGVT